jgi:antitoxin HigA-1
MISDALGPVHPGEVLREEFLLPLGMSPYALAKALHAPRTRIERLVREETPVTPDTALRLARYLGTTAEIRLGMQTHYDIETAQRAIGEDIDAIRPRKAGRTESRAAP